MKKLNKKGFTLAELLIVVAIIAVLVAIAIPVFTAQLEKAREATDAANIRAAYAEVLTDLVSGETGASRTVVLKQGTDGWQNTFEFPANLLPGSGAAQPTSGQTVTIKANSAGTGAEIDILLVKA